MPQQGLGQAGEHVGLVVGGLALAQEHAAVRPGGHPGVMAGGDKLGAHLLPYSAQSRKFYQRVAAGAGQGRAPCQILPGKIGADEMFQLGADIHRVEGQAQAVRQRLGVPASPQADVQKDAVYVIALPQQRGGYGGVHSAGKSQNQLRLHRLPPRCQPFSSQIISAAISDGLTPEMREA